MTVTGVKPLKAKGMKCFNHILAHIEVSNNLILHMKAHV